MADAPVGVDDVVAALDGEQRRDQQPCPGFGEPRYVTTAQHGLPRRSELLIAGDEVQHLSVPVGTLFEYGLGQGARFGVAADEQEDALTVRRECG